MGCNCTVTKEVGQTPAPKQKEETVGEYLDKEIQDTRQRLERMCITKAKAEATQMLGYPINFIRNLVSPGYDF